MNNKYIVDKIRLNSNLNMNKTIEVSHAQYTYGNLNNSIVSIGLIEKGKFRNKLEVPYENISKLLEILKNIKKIDLL